jgi:hypothetical protein
MRILALTLIVSIIVYECIAIKLKNNASGNRKTSRKSLDTPRRRVVDDEDDEDAEPIRSSAAKKSKVSFSKSSRKMPPKSQLVRWDPKKDKSKTKPVTSSIAERFFSIASTGQNAYKSAYRQMKAMRSSAFESMLLKATWPNDEAVPNEILNEIINHSIPAFKYGRSVRT